MELYDMNLTDIISTATREISAAPNASKLSVSIIVLGYLLGRDIVKYALPLIQKYIEKRIRQSVEGIKLE